MNPNDYVELGKVAIGGMVAAKPLSKLIEVASSAVGTMYKPKAMRNEAEAKAYEIIKIAEANAKAIIISDDIQSEMAERAKQRLFQLEMTRQTNIENIVDQASMLLPETVSETPVNDDWKTRFFNKAQDVSSEDLQTVWAKILANEVTNPGCVSLRTLDIISNLTKQEAEIFQKVCILSACDGSIYKIGRDFDDSDLTDYDIKYNDLMILRAAGLVNNGDNVANAFLKEEFTVRRGKLGIYIDYGDYKIFIHKENVLKITLPIFSLTMVGIEMMNIINKETNCSYLNGLISKLVSDHYEAELINNKVE